MPQRLGAQPATLNLWHGLARWQQPPTLMNRSLLLGLALTALSLGLHFAPIWVTMLNRGPVAWDKQPLAQDYLVEVIDLHRSGSDMSFRRRPLTTWCVDAIAASGLGAKAAFILWGFSLFLAAGMLVHALARALGSSQPQALVAQAAFHLSPTVLCAWFEPMYTYDEPLQYAAFLLALLAAWRGHALAAALCMAISIIAHETSLLLLPALAAVPRHSPAARWVLMIAPPVLFAAFLLAFLPAAGIASSSAGDALARLGTIGFNFSNAAMAGETVGYLLMTLLFPALLLWRSGRRGASPGLTRAFWIALALNTAAVLWAAKAREARVFALPLLIAWPLLGKALADVAAAFGGWRVLLKRCLKPRILALLTIGSAAAYLAVRRAFVLSSNVPGDNLWHEFLALALVLSAALLLARPRSEALAPQLEVPA